MKLRRRIKHAWIEYQLNRHLRKMQGGWDYEAHCIEYGLRRQRELGDRVPHPTRIGLHMLVLWGEIVFCAKLARFAAIGYDPEHWFTNPEGPCWPRWLRWVGRPDRFRAR